MNSLVPTIPFPSVLNPLSVLRDHSQNEFTTSSQKSIMILNRGLLPPPRERGGSKKNSQLIEAPLPMRSWKLFFQGNQQFVLRRLRKENIKSGYWNENCNEGNVTVKMKTSNIIQVLFLNCLWHPSLSFCPHCPHLRTLTGSRREPATAPAGPLFHPHQHWLQQAGKQHGLRNNVRSHSICVDCIQGCSYLWMYTGILPE